MHRAQLITGPYRAINMSVTAGNIRIDAPSSTSTATRSLLAEAAEKGGNPRSSRKLAWTCGLDTALGWTVGAATSRLPLALLGGGCAPAWCSPWCARARTVAAGQMGRPWPWVAGACNLWLRGVLRSWVCAMAASCVLVKRLRAAQGPALNTAACSSSTCAQIKLINRAEGGGSACFAR